MYKPAPLRTKKTNIVRNRTGCRTCRSRRKKCDERKPVCNQCLRHDIPCGGYAPRLQFRDVNFTSPSTSPHKPSNGPPPGQSTQQFSKHRSSPSPSRLQHNPLDSWSHPAALEMACSDGVCESSSGLVPNFSDTFQHNQVRPLGCKLFYLMAWEDLCGPALAPAFKQLGQQWESPPVIMDTMIALSAYHLSRMKPHQSNDIISGSLIQTSRPISDHFLTSLEFYGSAMRHIAKWSPAEHASDPATLLSVLILFCCLESAMGHFREFSLHSQEIQRIIQTAMKSIVGRYGLHGTRLLSAWTQTRMHNWWLRVNFSDPRLLMSPRDVSVGPEMQPFLNIAANRRTFVLSTLCESYRLGLIAIVRYANSSANTTVHDTVLEACHEAMEAQRQVATDWHALVALQDLPIDGHEDHQQPVGVDNLGAHPKPLYFGSHTAAMNYAYYVTARIMQCLGLKESSVLESKSTPDAGPNEVDFWAQLLLRITAGMNWEMCLSLNRHTIGISSLLIACALRCADPPISLWIENWLGERCAADSPEEGSVLVVQILQMIQLINRERKAGRDALTIFDAANVGADESQATNYVLALWRDRDTGVVSSHHLSLSVNEYIVYDTQQ